MIGGRPRCSVDVGVANDNLCRKATETDQTFSCLKISLGLQLAYCQRRDCHIGAPLVMIHLVGLLMGGKTSCHRPFLKLTVSIFRKKTGRTLKRKEMVTCFLPTAKASATMLMGLSSVLERASAAIVWGSSSDGRRGAMRRNP